MIDKEFIARYHYDEGLKRCGSEPYKICEEIIRCRDCRFYYAESGTDYRACHKFAECDNLLMDENDFCSYGERKDYD